MKMNLFRSLLLVSACIITACSDSDENHKLSHPSNIRVADYSENSLTFAWDAVEGAKGYNYQFSETESGKTIASSFTTETTLSFGDLQYGAQYSLTLQTVAPNPDMKSDYSQPVTGTPRTKSDITEYPELALPTWENDTYARAFPGAEGGGMYVTGGRGGKVYRVTTLADSKTPTAGMLRYALNQKGPRTIVFEVSGIIELVDKISIKNGDLTIAGQTAPGDGICIANFGVSVGCDNVIIRYMRFRMGDKENQEADALEGRWQKNIIVDHCSFSWTTDECASFYANENFTMSWCILAESLRNSKHEKGTHGYGAIWGGVNASYHHNLLAHHDSRNPRFDGSTVYQPIVSTNSTMLHNDDRSVDYRNCVVYNFSGYPAYGGDGQKINFVGNYYKWGPGSEGGAGQSKKYDESTGTTETSGNSAKKRLYYYTLSDKEDASLFHDNSSNYFSPNNRTLQGANGFYYSGSASGNGFTFLSSPISINPDGVPAKVTYHTAENAFDAVLEYAGASLARDAVDDRIVLETMTGTATFMKGSNGSINGFIDSQQDVGGWPQYTGTAQPDTDGDGIPDWFEDKFGLDKNNAADGNFITLDPTQRYTNLEMYLYYLVKDITLSQKTNGAYIQQN